jgi:hypothetical protein
VMLTACRGSQSARDSVKAATTSLRFMATYVTYIYDDLSRNEAPAQDINRSKAVSRCSSVISAHVTVQHMVHD